MESIKALRFGWNADLTNASQRGLSQIFFNTKDTKDFEESGQKNCVEQKVGCYTKVLPQISTD